MGATEENTDTVDVGAAGVMSMTVEGIDCWEFPVIELVSSADEDMETVTPSDL